MDRKVELIGKETRYENNAKDSRPRIEIMLGQSNCITTWEVDTTCFDLETNTIKCGVTISLELSIKIKNIGNSTAKFVGLSTCQKNTKENILRDVVLGRESKVKNCKMELYGQPFFEITALKPSEECTFSFQVSRVIVDSTGHFIYHQIILYENELGVLFDTYIKLRFQPKPLFRDRFNGGSMVVKDDLKFISEVTDIASQDSKYYTLPEKDQVYRNLLPLVKQFDSQSNE